MDKARRPMGVSILGYLGCFAALAYALLGVVAFMLPAGTAPLIDAFPFSALSSQVLGAVLLAFAAFLALASVGMLRQHRGAWLLGIGLVALTASNDLARISRGDWGGAVGILIVATMIWYLLRPEVRAWFAASG